MISKSQKRFALAALALFVIAAFVVPAINVGRYRAAVSRSLSAALGRDVTVRDVSMHLLPAPGLTLKGLVVADDPRFGAEPILRAEEVNAALRLSSLWRGRLEISQLSLSYPSLNLVRMPNGQWNVESLFERVREIPTAPTVKTRPEVRSRFPYIESTGGRINLKLGLVKTVYALNDADFALWLASEDEWRMRLEARPMRTDANLSDTGLLRVEGSARRAASLGETPLLIRINWERGQLGQITTLLRGRDGGWRGGVQLNATLSGTPHDLHILAETSVQDFRRYDISAADSLLLYVRCTANYNHLLHSFADISCASPAGDGQITANGTANLATPRQYRIAFSVTKVPAQFAVTLARHAKQSLALDLTATGTLDGEFGIKSLAGQTSWSGNGTTSEWELRSKQLGSSPLVLSPVRFKTDEPAAPRVTPHRNRKPAKAEPTQETRLVLQPFSLDIGGSNPATLSGWMSPSSYHFELQGDGELKRVLQVSSSLGLYAPATALEGDVKLAGDLNGQWTQFHAPVMTGKAQLRNVTAGLKGFAVPLHMSSADLVAEVNKVSLQNMALAFPGVHVATTGSLELPRGCQPSADCSLTFDLKAESLALDDLNRLVNPKAWDRPWYQRLVASNSNPNAPWSWIYAKGHVTVQKLMVKAIPVTKLSSTISIAPGSASLIDLRGGLLGGTYVGEFLVSSLADKPAYQSKGQFDHIAMNDLATAMKDGWATGTLSLGYEGTATGWQASDILGSASATAKFDWHSGSLQHVSLGDTREPLAIQRFAGDVLMKDGLLSFSEGKLQNHAGIYQISGTASFTRDLKMTLRPDSGEAYSITGTLARPKVAVVPTAIQQAARRGRSR